MKKKKVKKKDLLSQLISWEVTWGIRMRKAVEFEQYFSAGVARARISQIQEVRNFLEGKIEKKK